MAEYGREQRNQLSRTIVENKTKGIQSKELVDNRDCVIQSINPIIQKRSIGFEFESKSKIEVDKEDWNSNTKITEGYKWELCPDEIGRKAKEANIEFKVGPFETDAAEEISTVFGSLREIINEWTRSGSKKYMGYIEKYGKVYLKFESDNTLKAQPQVTAEISNDSLLVLLNKSSMNGNLLVKDDTGKDAINRALRANLGGKSEEYKATVSLLSSYIIFAYKRYEEMNLKTNSDCEEYTKVLAYQDKFNCLSKQNFGFNDISNEIEMLTFLNIKQKIQRPKRGDMKKWRDNCIKSINAALKSEKEKRLNEIKKTGWFAYAKATAAILPRIRLGRLPEINSEELKSDIVDTVAQALDSFYIDENSTIFPMNTTQEYNVTIKDWVDSIQEEYAKYQIDNNSEPSNLWSSKEIESRNPDGTIKSDALLYEFRSVITNEEYKNMDYTKWENFAKTFITAIKSVYKIIEK